MKHFKLLKGIHVILAIVMLFIVAVPVYAEIDPLILNPITINLEVGESKALGTPLLPWTATWSTNDNSIVKVSNTGVVTGINPGTVTVTMKYNGTYRLLRNRLVGREYVIVVTSKEDVEKTEIRVGESIRLNVEKTNLKTVTWSTSDRTVLTVDNTGLITGISPGTAIVTATIRSRLFIINFLHLLRGNASLIKTVVFDIIVTPNGIDSLPTDDCYEVRFESNGGSEVEGQIIKSGDFVVKPSDPTRNGHRFDGWFVDSILTSQYDFATPVNNNFTLYASWIAESNSELHDIFNFNLGEDINSEITYESEDANPTFDSITDEIVNLAELNDGIAPICEADDNNVVCFIDGKFSDKSIQSADDALDALNDIHHIMGFENVYQEFEEVRSESVDLGRMTHFYRLQQMFHGVPVYGYQLIVSTGGDGSIETLSGHYYPNIDVSTTPAISMQDAKNLAMQHGDEAEVVSDGLFIYIDETARLCWKIKSFSSDYFIDAQTGEVINVISSIHTESTVGSGITLLNEDVEFPVWRNEQGQYQLLDKTRNIVVMDANHGSTDAQVVESNDNTWEANRDAISVYNNIIKTYDYYANVLGRDGADNEHKQIVIICNLRDNGVFRNGNNAAFSRSKTEFTLLGVGDGSNFAACLDILAHEYTHAITNAIWEASDSFAQSKALNESYSDIIGNLIEEGTLTVLGEHLTSGARSFSNATVMHYSQYSENNDEHDNCGIMNHAAYLMDQNWPVQDHADELATLFYKSMNYMSPNSGFLDSRYALLAASKSLNMNAEKRTVIAQALDDVGIIRRDKEAWAAMHHIKGVVKDANTGMPIIDASVIAVATEWIGGAVGYSNSFGDFDLKLSVAEYEVKVYADGYRSYKIEHVSVTSLLDYNVYLGTIYLTPLEWGESTDVFASGYVTNALTGENLSDVTVKFRQGSNNHEGEYVQTVSGLDIELVTNESGRYYTAALKAGNYTLEASKEGFITGYINIISGNSEFCNNQNVSLSPTLSKDNFRIVLTWGENPRDLDSHMVGNYSGGLFHVYFGSSSISENGVEICSLDVDDTTSYGPETITLKETNTAPYYYYVYHYAGSNSLRTSGAKVTVYQGNNLLGTFNVPTDQGDERYWNVFAIVDGKIVVGNTITTSSDTGYAANE